MRRVFIGFLCIVLAGAGLAQADAPTLRLRADSSISIYITGDLQVFSDRIVFGNGAVMRIERVERDVYRVLSQPDKPLLEGNTLCGAPVTFVTLHGDGFYALNAFEGAARPATPVAGSFVQDGACAAYGYGEIK